MTTVRKTHRRRASGLALAAALAAAPSLAPGGAAAADVTLTFASYGGALQVAEEAAWIKPFMEANPGVEIVYDIVDNAKMKAMVESGNVVWDVASVGPDFGLKSDEALLEPIDCTVVACSELQPELFMTTGYRAACCVAGLAIGYNTTMMPEGKVPQNWVDFFDTATFPGKRVVMMDAVSMVFEQALLGDGVAPEDLYPLDLDRAVAKLDSLGDDLIISPGYQACAELVAAGEAAMGGCWTGRFFDVIEKQGAPVAVQWNQNLLSNGFLVVPKGTPNREWAMKFIAFATSAEHNASLSDHIAYGPPNIKALANVDPAGAPKLQSTYLDQAIAMNDIWHDENKAAVTQRYAEWTAGVN